MKFKPKTCVDCGKEFEPRSGSQVRCLECRKTHVSPSQRPKGRRRKASNNMPKMTIRPPDPTRGREPKTEREIERIGNTELGSRLRARMSEIERESFERFREERDGDV